MKGSLRVLLPFLVCVSTFCLPRAVHAQGDQLSFSGGNGTPLTLTLAAPLSYTIDADFGNNGPNAAPSFLFLGIVNDNTNGFLTGNMTFSINGGSPYALTFFRAGGVGGANPPGVEIKETDWYIFGDKPGVSIGDTVTLNPGSLTTVENFAAAPPADGVFFSYIFDPSFKRISTVAVPEPSTWMLIGAGMLMLVAVRRRRRGAQAPRLLAMAPSPLRTLNPKIFNHQFTRMDAND